MRVTNTESLVMTQRLGNVTMLGVRLYDIYSLDCGGVALVQAGQAKVFSHAKGAIKFLDKKLPLHKSCLDEYR